MASLDTIYRIGNTIDTFALGHYARVFEAYNPAVGGVCAFKVMRQEHLAPGSEMRWEYRAFPHEADLLTRLADSPVFVRLLDCGYVSGDGEAPTGGAIEQCGRDAAAFGRAAAEQHARGWRPYLALEYLPRANNLFYQMRPDRHEQRMRLPTEEGIALALQFAETLRLAHRQGIVYMDHKLEHVYWDGVQLRIIDLNSSRALEGRSREHDAIMITDIHNLCVGILYSMFTGLSPQKTALRPQPGSWSDVEQRYQDVNTLDFGIEPTLSASIREVLQRGAAMQINGIDDFIHQLQGVAMLHGWDFPNQYAHPLSRDARAGMRAALAKLRQGQEALREARDRFRDGAIQEGIPEDMEAEMRRLTRALNDMLNHRPIP